MPNDRKILFFRAAKKNSDDMYVHDGKGMAFLDEVAAIVPYRHSYHSSRPAQELSKIILRNGTELISYDQVDPSELISGDSASV